MSTRGTRRGLQADWRRLYHEGARAVDDGDVALALRQFEEAVAANPDAWQPRFARAWVHCSEHDSLAEPLRAQTTADLEFAVGHGGDACPDAAVLLAKLLHEAGDFDRAFRLALRATGGSSLPESESLLVETLVSLLNAIEADGPAKGGIEHCQALEAYVASAVLPRIFEEAILGEIVATRATVCKDATEQAAQWRRLAQLIPGHDRLPTGLDQAEQTKATVAQQSTASNEPTFAQLAGAQETGSFQGTLVTTFENYFASPDLGALRDRLREFGLPTTQSVLMYGPSGAGKTYVVRAFAGEYHARYGRQMALNSLRLNIVMDKHVGETEKVITSIFDKAIRNQPSIVFIDEVDALGGTRSDHEWKVAQTSHLLQEIDRLKQSEAVVLLVGCTNRLSAIDPAMIRRFDQLISADLPDQVVRQQLLEVHLAKLSTTVRSDNLNLVELAKMTHGMAPGDIEKAVRRAADTLMKERTRSGVVRRITQADLEAGVRENQNPLHIRRWLRGSVDALRANELDQQAEELLEKYKPFVGLLTAERRDRNGGEPLPPEAWSAEPQFDFSWLRGPER